MKSTLKETILVCLVNRPHGNHWEQHTHVTAWPSATPWFHDLKTQQPSVMQISKVHGLNGGFHSHRGTPKSPILTRCSWIGFSLVNHPLLHCWVPHLWNPPNHWIFILCDLCFCDLILSEAMCILSVAAAGMVGYGGTWWDMTPLSPSCTKPKHHGLWRRPARCKIREMQM